jgi:hypothetical protein
MTYKEYYLTLDSIDEIKSAVEYDLIVAKMINPDRTDKIIEAANEAIEEKLKEQSDED